MYKVVLTFAAMLALAACGNDPGTRALTGGAIGAGSGAVIGSVTPRASTRRRIASTACVTVSR